MKKTLRKRIGELVFLLFINITYFISLWMMFEHLLQLNKIGSIGIAGLLYLEYCISEHKRDELEERIKKLEENSKL